MNFMKFHEIHEAPHESFMSFMFSVNSTNGSGSNGKCQHSEKGNCLFQRFFSFAEGAQLKAWKMPVTTFVLRSKKVEVQHK